MSVLSVSGLSVHAGSSALVDDVSFALEPGERVGLIGESGSGKSMTALAVMGLLPEGLRASGSVGLAGESANLLTLRERQLSALRGSRLGMVFQEPMSALNPTMRVGDQLAEVLRIHGASRQAAAARAVELLTQVRLPDPAGAVRAYPHQLSGGQRQRVMIAMALANDPLVLICDEPTSALDVTVQAKILELVVEATADLDTSVLFITHDLPVVATVCERVLVMKDGAIVESGPVASVFTTPEHPYTRLLLDAATFGRPTSSSHNAVDPIVDLSGVSRTYRRPRRSLFGPRPEVRALRDVRMSIAAGQRFGVVGESGSGKSTLVRLIAGLDKPSVGSIRFAGRRIEALPERRLRFLREDLQMVFQDPAGSLDPRMRVRDIVAEPLVSLQRTTERDVDARVAELLTAVGLPTDSADRYPHQFSGGQRQRISIARALAPRPRVLVADEPVSALDAPIRAQILELLARLVDEYDLTMVFVSHDLTVVRQVCDMVAVLHDGELVELGPTEQVYTEPQHPYTRELLAAVPTLEKALASKGVR
ncbi:dipeptide ABC transporter ATP-binding protein [Tenggerimyces flavus]|uniref:Dipeptide ABC transporter ATP-binding protein n=1 Tax=Tenggerimyces flavus TaxID=1708749 RepID=A0ABV7YKZ1_9ACTN|nr:ABC transporter ATP-binding protein [Tenggerimyces flavus]MBM7787499.1 peptide/nickel transport system ATP-binding protein [Tenggerimyces flavus]